MSSTDPSAEHAIVQRLLPWLPTGTLDGAERARVELHLRGCADCRAQLAWERRLRAAGREAPACQPALNPDAAFARLAPRLDAPTGLLPILRRWVQALPANDGWLRPLAVAQCGVIALLAALLLARPDGDQDEASYRTLGAGAPVQGDLVVSFRPDTPERELRRILEDSGARLVEGPSPAAAWVLAAPAPARALARLRTEPAVTLAQPLRAEARP